MIFYYFFIFIFPKILWFYNTIYSFWAVTQSFFSSTLDHCWSVTCTHWKTELILVYKPILKTLDAKPVFNETQKRISTLPTTLSITAFMQNSKQTLEQNVTITHALTLLFYLLLFSYSCPTFFPIAFPFPIPPHSHSQSPHCPCLWALYLCSFACPFPFFPLLPTPLSPLVTVSLFFISKSIVLFCSFVCFVD